MKSSDTSSGKPENERFGSPFLIVGLGASAGGIQALKEFFEQVPADSGIAYVVILHLSPDYDSQLTDILRQSSGIPVTEVTEKIKIAPNQAYVISPNHHLLMEDGFIIPSSTIYPEERRAPVDIFFRTLAEAHGPLAVCVILSGTGANGSMGLKRVKERGGVVFVQNPREAEFNEMPRNAIATDLADEVLSVADIPAKIISYKNNLGTVYISTEAENRSEEQQQALREIFTQLRLRTGHDFSNYKRPTLMRRIERRMNIRNLHDLPAYTAFIQQNPEEITSLLKDLLISVTNFFRDKKAWDILESELIPRILGGKTAKDQVRIWVAGCATGEEAYSMAMLCAEKTLGILDAPKVQVFATDIDEAAISQAREGFYTLNDTADVSPDRLRRFFTKEGEGFRIRREIRETIMFAHHNFIKDPPFSHLDMISCRNVLIYLNHIAQERVAETFHFALDPGGYLFLGSSESVDRATDLYTSFNREHHIFQSRQVNTRVYPVPESVPAFKMEQIKVTLPLPEQDKRGLERISYGDLHQRLLEQYAPPSVVVNQEYDIVHLSEQAGRYLQIGGGEISQNLLKLVRPELRLELRSALFQSIEQQTAVKARPIKVSINNQVETISVHVRPVLRPEDVARGFILVFFETATTDDINRESIVLTSNESATRHLEEELIRMKAQLRSTIEQYEFQGEELKASNEELQAMNEELRSAAEELETSKEELQSINEEMRTINQELKVKIEETSLTSNNLQNLMNSANIATVFLDRSFRVALFTPAIREIFNLIPGDHGRPITDITNRLNDPNLLADAEQVLEKLHMIEREVMTTDGRFYLMRLLPYRTDEDRINGVVVTFFDVTRRKLAEDALRASEEKYRSQLEREVSERTAELKASIEKYLTLVENTPDVITRWNSELKLEFANSAFEGQTGMDNDKLYGKNNSEMGQSDDIALPYMESLQKVFQTGKATEHFNAFPAPHGEAHFYSRIVPEKNEAGEVESVLAIARDITELKNAEQEIIRMKDLLAQRATDKYRLLVDNMEQAFCIIEMIFDKQDQPVDYRFLEVNPAFEKQTVLRNVVGKTMRELEPQHEEYWFHIYGQVAKTGRPIHFFQEARFIGNYFYELYALPTGVEDSNEVAVFFNDITERRRTEENLSFLADFSEQLLHLADTGDVMQVLGEKIGAYFGAIICAFIRISEEKDTAFITDDWHLPGIVDLEESYHLPEYVTDEFRQLMANGQTVVVQDIKQDSRIQNPEKFTRPNIGSFVNIPLIRNGEWLFTLGVYHEHPYNWRDDQLNLLHEITTRIWNKMERARAEEFLRISEERYRIALQSAEMAAWDWDIVADRVIWNDQHYTLLGLQPSEEIKDSFFFLRYVYPEDVPRVSDALENAVRQTGVYEQEFRVVRDDDNSIRWMSGYGRTILQENGVALRMIGVMYDITKQKLLEQQKEDFIGIASHELRTPVTGIKAYAELLMAVFEDAGDTDSKFLMQKMDRQIDRLMNLIRDLLDTTRIYGKQLTLHYQSFSIGELLRECIEELAPLFSGHSLKLQVCETIISADRERIKQVLVNLISNAVKYSPDGSEVLMDCRQEEEGVLLCVHDRGVGIAADLLDKVFDRFFRVRYVDTHASPGMGLGLYITAGIVRQHGGSIWAESTPGQGSVFYVRLPYKHTPAKA